LGAGALTLILYTPVLIISGWRKLLANSFVQPVNAQEYFDWVLASHLTETLKMWMRDVPLALVLILALGLVLSLAFHRRIQSTCWPLSLVLLAWIAFLLVSRRPEAYDRFWSWLIAPVLLWAAAGIVETARALAISLTPLRGAFPGPSPIWGRESPSPLERGARSEGNPLPAILTGLALVWLIASLTAAVPSFPEKWAKVGNPQAAALYLKENMQPGEVALVGYPNNAPVWYYLGLYGAPETAWRADGAFRRAYVLVAANQSGQSPESVIKSYKLDPAAFDLEGAEGLARYGQILIYRVARK
jgi:hypothetical protein